ncbi:DUF4906 domain-containing protein [Parabacteroides sp.]
MKKITILLFLSLLYLAGCVNEDFVNQAGNVREGEPAQVNLKVGVTPMGVGLKTRALDPDDENKISNLRILIFNSKGEVVTNKKYDNDPGTSLNLETVSGSGQTICMVANVMKEAIDQRLEAIATYSQLKEVMVTAEELDNGLDTTHPLMMTAVEENVTIAPGSNKTQIEFNLQFLAAKLTLKVVDKTGEKDPNQSVTLIGWNIIDGPARSYIFGNETKDANTDHIDDDGYWVTSTADYPFDKDQGGVPVKTLYLLENRRGGRVDNGTATDPYDKMDINDQDSRGKRHYRPKRATAIMIRAMHMNSGTTKQVKAYIYIGANNHSDYNIERGKHYEFTVTVNGLNDIEVDTNVDYADSGFTVDYGDNLTMDAHPDFRPMRIHAPKGKVTMEVLDSQGRTYGNQGFDATWVKISPLDLMFHQVKQSGSDADWQQNADPTSKFVRPKYVPHKSVRTRLGKEGIQCTPVPNGDSDEDNTLSFDKATYRMCYQITDIPFEDIAVTNRTLYVYADEYLDKNATTRTATIKFSYQRDGSLGDPEVLAFKIFQKSYLPVFNDSQDAGLLVLDKDGKPTATRKKFVFEQFEEVNYALYPGMDPSLQRTYTMQWGFHEFSGGLIPNYPILNRNGDRFRNGQFSTASIVYNDVSRDKDNKPVDFGKKVDSYRPMFSSRENSPHIPAYQGTNTGNPYYYPGFVGNIYHPIYKSSAARYCHEKNRDLNGDGIIDDSEAHWYLPSANQLLMASIAGKQDMFAADYPGAYWSSTEVAEEGAYLVQVNVGDIHIAVKGDDARVRCVRDL